MFDNYASFDEEVVKRGLISIRNEYKELKNIVDNTKKDENIIIKSVLMIAKKLKKVCNNEIFFYLHE